MADIGDVHDPGDLVAAEAQRPLDQVGEDEGHHAAEDGADQVLLFVVDILNEEATLLVPNEMVKSLAEASFGAQVDGDSVVLHGVMSRKKQIIPNLKL